MWTEDRRAKHSNIMKNSERAIAQRNALIARRRETNPNTHGTIARHDAKAAGLTSYFTGWPCKYGHIAPRWTSNGTCHKCEPRLRKRAVAAAKNKPDVWKLRLLGKRSHPEWLEQNSWRFSLYEAERKVKRRLASVSWGNKEIIKSLYAIAAAYRKAGIPCHVDHIVPLKSQIVCGLHVEANLTLLPPEENSRKSNRWWPDCPETWTRIS